jgi:uncharacterized protein YgbK (DUF1537 family)
VINNIKQRIDSLSAYDEIALERIWDEVRPTFSHKIIVLDDDPTGVQTVHDIPVFTDWSSESIEAVFKESRQMVFILTNSRAFSAAKTSEVHEEIARKIAAESKKTNKPFLLISRSDSTMRGHYPLETEVLKDTCERNSNLTFDGEIIMPFFKEGGRLTIDDVHYIKQDDGYLPSGESEFAKDRMFGFKNSNLRDWIEEKTDGAYPKASVKTISLDELRSLKIDSITDKLTSLQNFQKVVVNAVTEDDVKVFSIALLHAISQGKDFLYRTAASFTKVIGDVSNRPFLTKEELIPSSNKNGGLIVIGSHVQKTTDQLNHLKTLTDISFIEFNCQLVQNEKQFKNEIERVQSMINDKISQGETACIYTSRQRIDLGQGMEEEELALSVKISDAVTKFVNECRPVPRYVIAKGGITSSDVGTKGLEVKKAEVAGQITAGVPVWKTGEKSKFPNIPYIIFPGNVGEEDTLKKVVELLES